MEFLKRHYEKIILSLVLLGLGVAAWWLPASVKEAADAAAQAGTAAVPSRKGSMLPSVDLSKEKEAINQLTNHASVDISGGHNTFNPVTWKRTYDGQMLKVLVDGPTALVVTNLTPLYTVISFDRSSIMGCVMVLQTQSVKKPAETLKPGQRNKSGLYTLSEAKGASLEEADEVVVELQDTHEKASIKKGKDFQRVDGYLVDFWYEPDRASFKKKHINDTLPLSGSWYKILYITNDAVRLQDTNNNKQVTVHFTGTAN